MIHYRRTQAHEDILIPTLATLWLFSIVRMSFGFVWEDWGRRNTNLLTRFLFFWTTDSH